MAKLNYNLNAKLKRLKKAARASFMLGNSAANVAHSIGVSASIVENWHDDFVKECLTSGSSKRIFLREMLIKNSPKMIMILCGLAENKGDEKLAFSASSAVLSFASKFMSEDVRVANMEEKAKDKTGSDPMFKKTLFDFLDPDLDQSKLNKNEATSAPETKDLDPELLAFLENMGDEPTEKEIPPEARPNTQVVDLFDGIDDDELQSDI